MTALNGDVPMPEGSKKDGYSFSLKRQDGKKRYFTKVCKEWVFYVYPYTGYGR